MKTLIVLLIFAYILINETFSLKCAPTACNSVTCPQITQCGPGEIKARGGHCLCCDLCKKLVGEGVNCAADTPIAGQLSDKVACREGLICHGGVCKKPEAVYASYSNNK